MSSYQFSLAAKQLYEVKYPLDPPLTNEELLRFEQMYNYEEVDSIFSAVKKIKHWRGVRKRELRKKGNTSS